VNAKDDCTLALCKCGRAVFIGVTRMLDKDSKKEVGALAIAGYDIKHIPTDEAKNIDFGCHCEEKKCDKTVDMFGV
jgi:hypothetical protein